MQHLSVHGRSDDNRNLTRFVRLQTENDKTGLFDFLRSGKSQWICRPASEFVSLRKQFQTFKPFKNVLILRFAARPVHGAILLFVFFSIKHEKYITFPNVKTYFTERESVSEFKSIGA